MRVYARILTELGRTREAIAAHDELIAMLEPGATVELREWIADALLRKGDILRERGDRARLPPPTATRSTGSRSIARASCRVSPLREGSRPRGCCTPSCASTRRSSSREAIVERFGDSADAEVQERVEVAQMIVTALAYRKRLLGLVSRAGRAFWPGSALARTASAAAAAAWARRRARRS